MLLQNKLISAAGIILLASLAMPAGAGTLYKWTADDGSVAYSDDLERIPERYRDRAETLETGGLDGYERFTPADSAAQGEQRRLLEARLERLRAQNRPAPTVAAPAPGGPGGPASETIVQVNDSTALRIPATASDEEPIVVEEVRVLRKGSNITVHDTVVRQGDKVLVVVRPAEWMQGRPDYIREHELFE